MKDVLGLIHRKEKESFGFILDGERGPSSSGWMFVPGMDHIFPASGIIRYLDV